MSSEAGARSLVFLKELDDRGIILVSDFGCFDLYGHGAAVVLLKLRVHFAISLGAVPVQFAGEVFAKFGLLDKLMHSDRNRGVRSARTVFDQRRFFSNVPACYLRAVGGMRCSFQRHEKQGNTKRHPRPGRPVHGSRDQRVRFGSGHCLRTWRLSSASSAGGKGLNRSFDGSNIPDGNSFGSIVAKRLRPRLSALSPVAIMPSGLGKRHCAV